MGRKKAISTISLITDSLGPKGFENSLDIATLELKLDGIQALPMRGWPACKDYYASLLHEPWDKMVLSFEGPWNSGSVWQAMRRRFNFEKEGDPTFLDLYLFGVNPMPVLRAMGNVFGWDKYISHRLGYKYMTEIYPVNVQIQNYIDYKYGLVWDTWHVREKGMPDWRDLLSALSTENIKMIHLHPKDEDELTKLIKGEENELTEMLHALRLKVSADCPVVLETRPKISFFDSKKSKNSMIKELCMVRDVVFDILG